MKKTKQQQTNEWTKDPRKKRQAMNVTKLKNINRQEIYFKIKKKKR